MAAAPGEGFTSSVRRFDFALVSLSSLFPLEFGIERTVENVHARIRDFEIILDVLGERVGFARLDGDFAEKNLTRGVAPSHPEFAVLEALVAGIDRIEVDAEKAVVGELEAKRVGADVRDGNLNLDRLARGISGIVHGTVLEAYFDVGSRERFGFDDRASSDRHCLRGLGVYGKRRE